MITINDCPKKVLSGASPLNSKRGQMSLVFLLLIAVALVFLGMTMNWGKMAQNRTQVSMAANLGAATMVSYMASYGENLLQSQLGGKKKKCDWTGLLVAIIVLVIAIIIAIVVIIVPWGTLSAWIIGLAIAAVVLAGAAVAINMAYIQPKMTELWNKMMANRSVEERFLYGGYQAAFPMAVSDQENVVDIHDFDMDSDQTDSVGRFSYFFTMHLWNDSGDAKCKAFAAFQDALEKIAVPLGVNKRASCEDNAACNKCCAIKGFRGGTCEDADIPQVCRDTTPYPGYPLVYDPLYSSRGNLNNLVGFAGLDDSRAGLLKNSPNDPLSWESVGGPGKFVGWDSEGFMFPFLWEVRDSLAKVYDMQIPAATAPGCHWCSSAAVGTCDPGQQALYLPSAGQGGSGAMGLATDQLVLPRACSGQSCCVNRIDDGYQIDTVDTLSFFINEGSGCPPATAGLFGKNFDNCESRTDDNNGAIHKAIKTNAKWKGVWRPGSDLFCGDAASADVPYYGNCDIHQNSWCLSEDPGEGDTCTCEKTGGGTRWHNDDLDDIGIQMRQLANDVYGLLADKKYCGAANVEEWGDLVDGQNAIQEWIDKMKELSCRLFAFEEAMEIWAEQSYAAQDAWCCPLKRTADMPDWESAACGFGAGAPVGAQYPKDGEGKPLGGTLNNIAACMEVNAEHIEMFGKCERNCRTLCFDYCDGYQDKDLCKERCEKAGKTCTDEDCEKIWDECRVGCGDSDGDGTYDPHGGDSDSFYVMPENFENEDLEDKLGASPESCGGGAAPDLPRAINDHEKNLSTIFEEEGCSSDFVHREHAAYGHSVNQQLKFEKRAPYLVGLQEAVNNKMRPKFLEMARVIRDNIPKLEAALAQFKAAAKTAEENAGSAKGIVYAWRNTPATGQDPEKGLWHVVHVQGGVPKRCGPPATCGTNKFPWIKTYKKSGGLKRCYEIVETEGGVGIQVSRWDESASSGSAFGKLLPSFRFNLGGNQADAETLHEQLNACSAHEDGKDLGAFISGWEERAGCLSFAEKLAKGGYKSKMCGRYFLKPGRSPFSGHGDHTFGIKLNGC